MGPGVGLQSSTLTDNVTPTDLPASIALFFLLSQTAGKMLGRGVGVRRSRRNEISRAGWPPLLQPLPSLAHDNLVIRLYIGWTVRARLHPAAPPSPPLFATRTRARACARGQ